MLNKETGDQIILKYGGLTGIGLIAYFLLMKVFGLIHVLELRFFNFFILSAGVLLTIRHYRHVLTGQVDYLKGFGLGFATSLVASAIFCIFFYIYLRVFDQAFMTYLIQNAPFGTYLNPLAASFGVMMEGTASGSVVALLSLQYYRKPKLSVRNPHLQ